MKLLTYRVGGHDFVGLLSTDQQAVIPLHACGIEADSMLSLLRSMSDDTLSHLQAAFSQAPPQAALPLSTVELRPPIPKPPCGMICIGYNFRNHAEEIAKLRGEAISTATIEHPIYFCKRIAHATATGDAIPYLPGYAENLDVGVEVCVVIGKDALNITPDEAASYIFGYTITNDVCDTRINQLYTQPFLGKSLDGYMPTGPWIVTKDEFDPEPAFDLSLTVNGTMRQLGNTRDLVFSIPYIVSELSQNMTLYAGTMIATGSPANRDAGHPEKLLLLPGDRISCSISGIGTLVNTVKEVKIL